MSTEKDAQRDLLKVVAYGTLANLWINLATKEAIAGEEADALLGVQDAVIKEFDKTLQAYLDEASMKTFREYVDKYKVRVS
jgi:hypothetical protein